MKRLPSIDMLNDAHEHRRRLGAWLVERSIDLALRDGGDGSSSLTETEARHAESALAVNQIRLLYPDTAVTRGRPVYVAVLEGAAAEHFLVAPFSPYAVPAFLDELSIDRDTLGVGVLALWNRRTVSSDIVGRSWLVDTLTAEEDEAIAAVLDASLRGELPPDPLHARVGPPVQHPLDPRWSYREEEAVRMDQAFDASANQLFDDRSAAYRDGQTYLRAAEMRRLYGRVPRFAVEGHVVVLQVAFDAGSGPDVVEVVDDAGRRSDDLEGGVVHTSEGRRSPPIQRGQIIVDRQFTHEGLSFIDIDGVLLNLQPVD